MASILEYFQKDFRGDTQFAHVFHCDLLNNESNEKVTIVINVIVRHNYNANAVYISFFIPKIPGWYNPIKIVNNLLHSINTSLNIFFSYEIGVQPFNENPILNKEAIFTGRVYVYHDGYLDKKELEDLNALAKKSNLYIIGRDLNYARYINEIQKPLAFISHDSRDKELIVKPIIDELGNRLCPVWYDEYSLEVGSSLRESIEKGLKECKKCILILSPNFLSNNGWTKVEFNSIFTREILETTNLILPVWCGVKKEDIYDYSPSLLNRVGLDWNKGIENVVIKLEKAIRND